MAGLAEQIDFDYVSDIHQRRTGFTAQHIFGDRDPATGIGIRYVDATSTRASLERFVVQSNINAPDFAVSNGDNVNGGTVGNGEARHDNFSDFVDRIDGTVGNALVAPLLLSQGHWDWGAFPVYTQADVDQYFDNTVGLGTILPGGGFAYQNAWWPTLAVTGNQPCAYTVVVKGWKVIVLCGIAGYVGMSTNGEDAGGVKTQQVWFQARLDEAEAAGQPVLVISHHPLMSNSTPAGLIIDAADAIDDGEGGGLENQTIPSIAIGAHIHYSQEYIIQGKLTQITGIGDVWTVDEDNEESERYTHYHFKIVPECVWDGSQMNHNIEVTGYGYGENKHIKYLAIGA